MMTTVPLRRSTKTKAPPPLAVGPAEDLAAAALSLARRFADGATMWCVAPAWPSHARHVAVEFVHPVIVGTRALPAVSLNAATAVESVRALSRPGDALLVVSTADHPVAHDLLTRAEAWGLTSVWLGAGPRPQPGAGMPAVGHVVWIDDQGPAVAARSGQLVLLYHLLWELTHVVFEHPGLLASDGEGHGEGESQGEVCITCSDEGRVAEVRTVLADGRVEVLAAGQREQIDGRLVEGLRSGDLVLVHAGVAVTNLTSESESVSESVSGSGSGSGWVS
jgi:hydrogenase maturation factor